MTGENQEYGRFPIATFFLLRLVLLTFCSLLLFGRRAAQFWERRLAVVRLNIDERIVGLPGGGGRARNNWTLPMSVFGVYVSDSHPPGQRAP
jgi:hypothetical protein